MTIHFTLKGVYADTEEERLSFYDRLCVGDPVIWGHIQLWRMEQKIYEELEQEEL